MAKGKATRPTASKKGRRASRHWREKFIAALAQSSNVTWSASQANISVSRVYQARSGEPEFARLWIAALWEGYEHLEMEVLRRLRQGDLLTNDGTKYDFANAIRLLTAHRENVARAQAAKRNVSAAEVRASIDRKVEEIRMRLSRESERTVSGG